jgi:predicted nuclease of restriction endonuclease-like (RecB) superfamily
MSTSSTPARRDSLPADYSETFNRLAAEVRSANIRASLKVNAELINLYWSIGHIILERQADEGWGTKVIARLSADLQREFPLMTGLSPRNLDYMRKFAAEMPEAIVQQAAAQLPWGHVMVLLNLAPGRAAERSEPQEPRSLRQLEYVKKVLAHIRKLCRVVESRMNYNGKAGLFGSRREKPPCTSDLRADSGPSPVRSHVRRAATYRHGATALADTERRPWPR